MDQPFQNKSLVSLFFPLLFPSRPPSPPHPSDGLTDCMDPDCCIQSPCQNSPLCRGSRDPLQIIQQSPTSQPYVRSFYDRVKRLVGRDSTHIIPAENPFNSRSANAPRMFIFTPPVASKTTIVSDRCTAGKKSDTLLLMCCC